MTIKLSNLVQTQLPEFISTHYSTFSKFLEKYYESLEIHGQPLDILSNLTSYYDINFYQENLLERGSKLAQTLSTSTDTIFLVDAKSFPDEYGYVKIDDEICFYTEKIGNTLTGVYRGVSGTTKLGELYNKTTYQSSTASNHSIGTNVQNISNLFLFAIVKSFESQYLGSIPKEYLTDNIDKRTLIKNISNFYKSKGSEKSIKFIFNSLVSNDPSDTATIRRPSEETLKASESDWIRDYVISVSIESGNPFNLEGQLIVQEFPYASAYVDRVVLTKDPKIVNLIIDESTVNSEFSILSYTELVSPVSSSDTSNFPLEVLSTRSWRPQSDRVYIANEEFFFNSKNINQFNIIKRTGSSSYPSGTKVYENPAIKVNGVKFRVTGKIYNLNVTSKTPYILKNTPILESKSGRSSRDPIVFDFISNDYRWIRNNNRQRPTVISNPTIQQELNSVNSNVSSIFEDESYFYLCSSGYPSFDILSSDAQSGLENNNYLKLIRKTPITNTDVYQVGRNDIGILVDGTLIYSKTSENFVKYGPIENITLKSKGKNYINPPVVLVNGSPSKAKAILSGNVVSEIQILTDQRYKKTPNIVITSGRGAQISGLVTQGRISELVITNPGEYYVAPPIISIRDKLGKGRFAQYNAVISSKGKIVGVEKINEGRNYTQENLEIIVIPRGSGAEASATIKSWYFDRVYQNLIIDDNGGIVEKKKFPISGNFGKTYAVITNPKKLRNLIGDNINSPITLLETPSVHSKIIGYAYDGNPIYGPYGYEDPSDPQSSIVRLRTGYTLNSSRPNGPNVLEYPLGSFDEDYTWHPNVNTGKTYLDENNGRFCVTPEYPQGVYAYFLTIDASGNSEFPYFLGKNYYAVPVDSNYNSDLTQEQIPRTAKILDFTEFLDNGSDFSAVISDTSTGFVNGFYLDTVTRDHNPGNKLTIDNSRTGGSGLEASVESVFGKEVEYINSKNTIARILTIENSYLFDRYILRQRNTGIEGIIVGDVVLNNDIVLEEISGKFDSENLVDLVDPDTNQVVKILNILLTKSGSYTAGSTVELTDGKLKQNSIKATGKILSTTIEQNTLTVLVQSGDFDLGIDNEDLVLQSSTIFDDVGISVSSTRSLSEGIGISIIDYNYALIKTTEDHNLSVNNKISVSINPDDNLTEKIYYVRKRIFQDLVLKDQKLNSILNTTGIGNISILSGGFYDTPGVFPATIKNAEFNVTITEYIDNESANLSVIIPGSGFSVGNKIPVAGGNGSGMVINIDEVGLLGEIQEVSISKYGTGYLIQDQISPIQNGGNGAVIELNYDTYNSISDIEIINKGSGFKEDEILQLDNIVGSISSRPALFRVDHAGLGQSETEMKVTSVENIASNDFLKIDNEIVKVISVNYSSRVITIERAQKGTLSAKHFNGAEINFDDFSYNFTIGEYIPEIGVNAFSPKVYSYDKNTNILTLVYEYGINASQTPNITISSFLRDLTPQPSRKKSVDISSVGNKITKLEFSDSNPDINGIIDPNSFVVNPNIDIQLYYKYIFNTSHSSMNYTYLDFSPSINYNLFTAEKVVGPAEPGTNLGLYAGEEIVNPDCFVSLKFGFGPAISSNTYTETKDLRFSNYYYFIVANNVETDGSKLQIIRDPLTGTKNIEFVTNNKILYRVESEPQKNATGDVKYTTTSPTTKGRINSIKVDNTGIDYSDIPIVLGIDVPPEDECILEPVNFSSGGGISQLKIVNPGKNYTQAKIIIEGDGIPGTYTPIINNGSLIAVAVNDPGSNFTRIPKIKVIESSHKIYATSQNIGLPKTVSILNSGNNYSSDNTTIPDYTSTYVVLLSEITQSSFTKGSRIRQVGPSGKVFFTGTVVDSLREGSNIVRFKDVKGELDKNYPLNGAKILSVLFSNYDLEIKSFYNKLGKFNSEKGTISSASSKITDSYYWQDYSYVIRSKTPIDVWRSLIKDVVHPAGFQLFGEVVVEATPSAIPMPAEQAIVPFVRTLTTGVERAYSETSKIQITELVESISNVNVQRGVGRLALDSEDIESTAVYDIILQPKFDGYVDADTGLVFGTKTFTLYDNVSGSAITPYNQNSLIISIDGVVQEPGASFTVNGNQITFNTAPLGPRVSEGQSLPSANYIAKVFEISDQTTAENSFKKIKNIFQRNGIWLDAANQIRFNRQFIVEETIGYIDAKYPNTTFDRTKCKRDIGYILDAFEHDLRFGGNSETVRSGKLYYNFANRLDFIDGELTETRDAYFYAAKLCAAAVRNWDVAFIDDPNTPSPEFEVIVTANSDLITVPSTFGLVEGMYLSSGNQFPTDTRIVEIIDENNVRVSNNAFTNIIEEDEFNFLIPIGEFVLPQPGNTEIEFEYNGIQINTDASLIVTDGITVTITAEIARLRQVRFSLSRINTGVFVDAANLIAANKKYITNETISYINSVYPGFTNPSVIKCKRDIGYLIDAVTYHLYYGGNNRIVSYAEKYYLANKLNYINDQLSETLAAFEYAVDLMVQAIDNPGAPFETVPYAVAYDVANQLDTCFEVKSALNSYKELYSFIIENGPNLVQKDFGNDQKTGKYATQLKTYSNYDILEDENILNSVEINGVWFAGECAEVVSSIYTLQRSLDDILSIGEDAVEVSLPDYFNNRNKVFELYTDEGDILKTVDGENLLVFLNGVLQNLRAYKILRSEDPLVTDKIEFAEAPKWDQSIRQLQLNQGLSVDYFYAYSIGAYTRRRIDETKIKSRNDYFILTEEGNQTIAILDPRYYTVFVDGVQQKYKKDYTFSSNRIIFNDKLKSYTSSTGQEVTSSVDIIAYAGAGNSNDRFLAFNFERGVYSSKGYLDIIGPSILSNISEWDKPSNSYSILLFNGDNPLGTVYKYSSIPGPDEGIRLYVYSDNNPEIDDSLPFILRKNLPGVEDLVFTFELIVSQNINFPGPDTYVFGDITVLDGFEVTVEDTATVVSAEFIFNFETNLDGSRDLERRVSPWLTETSLKNKIWRDKNKITANIIEGDLIQVDGESGYRNIISIPDTVKTTNYNTFSNSSDQYYGIIKTSPSLESPSGIGLALKSIIDQSTGSVVGLDYGTPDLVRLNLLNERIPDIGMGYGDGVYIDFIPVDGKGGGAFARTLTFGGNIVGIEVVYGGYGYTQPPIPVITRGYNIIKNNRNIDQVIERKLNISIPLPFTVNTQVEIINPNLSFSGSYIQVGSPDPIEEFIINKIIQSQINNEVESSFNIIGVPQEIVVSGEGLVSIVQQSDIIIPETLFIKPYETKAGVGASTAVGGEVSYLTESFVGAGQTLITPEALNQISALINIQFDPGDYVLFVTNTSNFPNSGKLIIDQEVVEYNGKLPDRFFITIRGALGSTETTHIVGSQVKLYLPFISVNGPPEQEIESISENPVGFGEIITSITTIYSADPQNVEMQSFEVVDRQQLNIEIIETSIPVDIVLQSTKFTNSEELQTAHQLTIDPAEFTLLSESQSNEILNNTIQEIYIIDQVYPDALITNININESSASLFSERLDTVTIANSISSSDLIVERKPVDIDTQEILVSLQNTEQSFVINIETISFVGEANTTSSDVTISVPSKITLTIPTGATVSEIIDKVDNTINEQSIVSIGSTLSITEEINITYQSNSSEFEFTSISEITSGIETTINDLQISIVDVSDIDSEIEEEIETIPETLVFAGIPIINQNISDEISIIVDNELINIGGSLARSQEIVKYPEESIEGYIGVNVQIEFSSIVDAIDIKNAGNSISTNTQIDSIVDNGAIDEFNEQINPSEIDLNP